MTIKLRKTRLVCISDTHNASPAEGAFKLPKGDVLIHAGDLTKQGTLAELRKTLDWIEASDFEVKLVVAGNHDVTLDADFYAEHGAHFHNQYPQNSQACINLIKEYHSITFLSHKSTTIRLTKDGGPRTSFKVFGSPYSPSNGLWGFGYLPEEASQIWDGSIPLDTDVVITHTPPKFHCDESSKRGAAGCEILRQKLWRVRPSLAICGHVHEGRGAERILWDLETPNVKYKEFATGYWTDVELGSQKQSHIDLTAQAMTPLDNDGSWGDVHSATKEVSRTETAAMRSSIPWIFKNRPDVMLERPIAESSLCQHIDGDHPAVWGQGGIPPSGRCDIEVLEGRLGRKETCVVNAAIMASSWPYKTTGNRKYNKAIVVDIDFPVWQQEDVICKEEQPSPSYWASSRSGMSSSSQTTTPSVMS